MAMSIKNSTLLFSFLGLILVLASSFVVTSDMVYAVECPPNDPQCTDGSLPPPPPDLAFTFKDIVELSISRVANPLMLLLVALAGMVFMWGLINYITQIGNKAELDKAKKYIIAGILGLVIMVSFVGLARWLVHIIGSNLFTEPPYPTRLD